MLGKLSRMAANIEGGEQILAALNDPMAIETMIHAANQDYVVVHALTDWLINTVTGIDLTKISVRQFIGKAITVIMREHGYEVSASGIRVPSNPYFSTGSIYRKMELTTRGDNTSMIVRIINALTTDEIIEMKDAAERILAERN